MMLARSGPKNLLFDHIQKSFEGIMKVALADALPDEINWEMVVGNWDLPFSNKVKPTATNPCTQKELDDIAAGKERTVEELQQIAVDKRKQVRTATAEMIDLIKKGRKNNDGICGPNKTLFEI